jgi:hypothetical protein
VPFQTMGERKIAAKNPIPTKPNVASVHLETVVRLGEIAAWPLTGSRSRSGASSNLARKVRVCFRRESKTKEMGYLQVTHLVKPRMALKPSAFPIPGIIRRNLCAIRRSNSFPVIRIRLNQRTVLRSARRPHFFRVRASLRIGAIAIRLSQYI